MGIPLWESPPNALDKSSATARCNVHSVNYTPAAAAAAARDPSTREQWSTLPHMSVEQAREQIRARASRPYDPIGIGAGNLGGNMLTLDEFLRETSQASATRDDAERRTTGAANRDDSERRTTNRDDSERRAANREHAERIIQMQLHNRRVRSGLAHPNDPPRSLYDHTPAGRARILNSMTPAGEAPGPIAPPTAVRPAAASSELLSSAHQDSFDTLVGQIRRIGALQDFMLSSVDSTTTSLEDSTLGSTGGDAGANTGSIRTAGDRDRSAVASLRVREARLRAMQTRIDLLASEFALLRNTRRELRRVEAEALETLQNSDNLAGELSGDNSFVPNRPPEHPDAVRRPRRFNWVQPLEDTTTGATIIPRPATEDSRQSRPREPPQPQPQQQQEPQQPPRPLQQLLQQQQQQFYYTFHSLVPQSQTQMPPPAQYIQQPPPPPQPQPQPQPQQTQGGTEVTEIQGAQQQPQAAQAAQTAQTAQHDQILTSSQREQLMRSTVMQMQLDSLPRGI